MSSLPVVTGLAPAAKLLPNTAIEQDNAICHFPRSLVRDAHIDCSFVHLAYRRFSCVNLISCASETLLHIPCFCDSTDQSALAPLELLSILHVFAPCPVLSTRPTPSPERYARPPVG